MRNKLGQFKKGHSTWNKNIKGIHLSPTSEFKKGENVQEDHPSWKGGIQHNKNDCTYINTGVNSRIRRPRQVMGKIPKGYIVYHLDGNKNNDSIENLEAISRAELLRRNNDKQTNKR